MNLIAIIPTYNEKNNIVKLIEVLEKNIVPKIKGYSFTILIVDDNSPDGTANEVKKLMRKWKNLKLIEGKKNGLGGAYIRGMNYAVDGLRADFLLSMDADLSHNPDEIPHFIKKLEQGYDMVVGSRYIKGGSIPKNWETHRKIFSRAGNLIVRGILMRFSLHDWTGSYRLMKKDVFLSVRTYIKKFQGYTFFVAFLHKTLQNGYKVGEVPIKFNDRAEGKSKINAGSYIASLLKYVISARIQEVLFGKFGKFLVVGGTGFIINAGILRLLVEGFNVPPTTANLAGAAVAIFSNFNLNNLWTFKHHRAKTISSYLSKLLKFYATSSIGVICIQTGSIFIGDRVFGKNYYFFYFILGTFLLLIWNFTFYNKFIWKKEPDLTPPL